MDFEFLALVVFKIFSTKSVFSISTRAPSVFASRDTRHATKCDIAGANRRESSSFMFFRNSIKIFPLKNKVFLLKSLKPTISKYIKWEITAQNPCLEFILIDLTQYVSKNKSYISIYEININMITFL